MNPLNKTMQHHPANRADMCWALMMLLTGSCTLTPREHESGHALSALCAINSDCEVGLICAFERCHVECNANRDCDEGADCVRGEDGGHVCQLERNAACQRDLDCPGKQVCGVDLNCRDACTVDGDCTEGQRCAVATKLCAGTDELDDSGQLTPAMNVMVEPGDAERTAGEEPDATMPEPANEESKANNSERVGEAEPIVGGTLYACDHTAVEERLITYFNDQEGSIGDVDDALRGGYFAFGVSEQSSGAGIRLSGTVEPDGSAGVNVWFAECMDASEFGGIQFDLAGEATWGEIPLEVQLRTHANYPQGGPDGDETQGGCLPDEGSGGEECHDAYALVPMSPAWRTVALPWSDFQGGAPQPGADPAGLLGMVFQVSGGDSRYDFLLSLKGLGFFEEGPLMSLDPGPQPEPAAEPEQVDSVEPNPPPEPVAEPEQEEAEPSPEPHSQPEPGSEPAMGGTSGIDDAPTIGGASGIDDAPAMGGTSGIDDAPTMGGASGIDDAPATGGSSALGNDDAVGGAGAFR